MVTMIKIMYSLILPPAIFIILMFALSIYMYIKPNTRRLSYILFGVTLLFYFSSVTFIGQKMAGEIKNEYPFPSSITGDSIVMLGQGSLADAVTVDGIGEVNRETAVNVIMAVKLYNTLKVPIILSGGTPDGVSGAGNEARLSKRALLAMQVPESKIIVEDKSRTTQENAINSSKIIKEMGFERPILVTSASHISRAAELFGKEGIEVLPVPTMYRPAKEVKHDVFDFIPSAKGITLVRSGLREMLGKLQ